MMVSLRSFAPAVVLVASTVSGIAAPALPTEAQLKEFEGRAVDAMKTRDTAAFLELYQLDGVPEATRDHLVHQVESTFSMPEPWGRIRFLSLEEGLSEHPTQDAKAYQQMVNDKEINGRKYVLNGDAVGFITMYYGRKIGREVTVGYDAEGRLRILNYRPEGVDEALYRVVAPISVQGIAKAPPSPEATESFQRAVALAVERGEKMPSHTDGVPADLVDQSDEQERAFLGGKGAMLTEIYFTPASELPEFAQPLRRGKRTYGLNLPFAGAVNIEVTSEEGRMTTDFFVGLTPEGELKKVYLVPVIPPAGK